MDWKQLIQWSLKHWYWYAVSISVCLIIGGLHFLFSAPVYNVSASLMLRQSSEGKRTTQEELMSIMGFGGDKQTADEVEVLTSRSLIQQVVDKLQTQTTYYKHNGRYWKCQYPQHDITLCIPDTMSKGTSVEVKISDNGVWKVKVKTGRFTSEKYTLTNPQAPFETSLGVFRFTTSDSVNGNRYRITYEPKIWAVRNTKEQIKVARLAKESNIIQLQSQTSAPKRAEEIINTLLDIYNDESTADKNRLAVQTGRFLDERSVVLAAELAEAEEALERYKRENRISNLDNTAETYRHQSDQYQRKIAQMEAEEQVLDFIGQQMQLPTNENSVLPSDLGISDAALQDLIKTYNAQIIRRGKLLQTASPDNPTVQRLDEQIVQTRLNIVTGIDKAKQTMALLKQAQVAQQKQYDALLSAMPEQEKRYLEMQRVRNTKEKQYIYLIQKRESNALLLASDAVPAKIIDRAQMNPLPVSPKLKLIILIALVLGAAIPLIFYALGEVKQELRS